MYKAGIFVQETTTATAIALPAPLCTIQCRRRFKNMYLKHSGPSARPHALKLEANNDEPTPTPDAAAPPRQLTIPPEIYILPAPRYQRPADHNPMQDPAHSSPLSR